MLLGENLKYRDQQRAQVVVDPDVYSKDSTISAYRTDGVNSTGRPYRKS